MPWEDPLYYIFSVQETLALENPQLTEETFHKRCHVQINNSLHHYKLREGVREGEKSTTGNKGIIKNIETGNKGIIKNMEIVSQEWWLVLVVPTLGKLSQEFQDQLGKRNTDFIVLTYLTVISIYYTFIYYTEGVQYIILWGRGALKTEHHSRRCHVPIYTKSSKKKKIVNTVK